MGGVSGPCGPTGPRSSHSNLSQDDVSTVKQGETTMRQVAQRLGVSEEALRKANPHIKNPNQLKAGQDICLPVRSEAKEAASTSKTTKSQDEPRKTEGGFKMPTYRKGNWEVSGKPSGGTSSVADGEGSTEARREQRDKLDGMRRRDDRDRTPAEIKKDKELAAEKARKATEPMMKDMDQQMPDGKLQREVGDAKERELRDEWLKREGKRFPKVSPQPKTDSQTDVNPPAQNKNQK